MVFGNKKMASFVLIIFLKCSSESGGDSGESENESRYGFESLLAVSFYFPDFHHNIILILIASCLHRSSGEALKIKKFFEI